MRGEECGIIIIIDVTSVALRHASALVNLSRVNASSMKFTRNRGETEYEGRL